MPNQTWRRSRCVGSSEILVALLMVTCALASACGAPDDTALEPTPTDVGTPIGAPATATIGSAGGVLSSVDGRLTVTIPPGALAADTVLTVQPVTNTAHGGVGDAYELLPDGQVFALPVDISLHYGDEDISGTAPELLGWAVQNADGYWELQSDTRLDTALDTLSVSSSHFSFWSGVSSFRIVTPSQTVQVGSALPVEVQGCVTMTMGVGPVHSLMPGTLCAPASVAFRSGAALGTWRVNGVANGDATHGTIIAPGVTTAYRAPVEVPTPDRVTISIDALTPAGVSMVAMKSIRIEPAETGYTGHAEFTQTIDTLETVVTADVIWSPVTVTAEGSLHQASGMFHVVVSRADCDSGTVDAPIPDSNELAVFTASDPITPSQYHWTLYSDPIELTLQCDPPAGGARVPTAVGVIITGSVGLCGMFPPYFPLTEESRLMGTSSCSGLGLSSISWDFTRAP